MTAVPARIRGLGHPTEMGFSGLLPAVLRGNVLEGRARPARPSCVGISTPAKLELLQAVIVADLLALGMEHVAVSIPDFEALGALALLHDLLQRQESRGPGL